MRRVALFTPRSPVEIEEALNLLRGKVLQTTTTPEGEMEVIFDDSVPWPDTVLRDKLERATGRKVRV